jgi:hypothetical protein
MQLFHLFTVHLTPLGRHQPESVHYTNYYTLAPDLQAAYVRIEGLGGVDQAAEVWGAALPEGHVVNAEAQQPGLLRLVVEHLNWRRHQDVYDLLGFNSPRVDWASSIAPHGLGSDAGVRP